MKMRPLHAHYPPAHSHLGGGGRMCLAERAWCPEMLLPTSQRCLTSKHSISSSVTYTAFGCQEPNSDLAKPMTGLIPNAKGDNSGLTSSDLDFQAWQDTSTPFTPKAEWGQKPGQAAREVPERRWNWILFAGSSFC